VRKQPRAEEEKPVLSQKAIRARKQKLMEGKKSGRKQQQDGVEMSIKKLTEELKTRDDTRNELPVSPVEDIAHVIMPPTKRRKKDPALDSKSDSSIVSTESPTVVSSSDASTSFPLSGLFNKDDEDSLKASPEQSTESVVELVEHVVNNVPDSMSSESLIPGLDGEIPESLSRKRASKHGDKKRGHGHKKGKHKVPPANTVAATVTINTCPQKFKDKEQAKEYFRNQIASVVVAHLNPFRKPDCTQGRIVCTEDFKHLARKVRAFFVSILLQQFFSKMRL